MPEVKSILAEKGSDVLSVSPSESVLEAAKLMNKKKVGALVVIVDRAVVGMFTERDLLQRVVAHQKDPGAICVEEVMTKKVIRAHPDDPVDKAKSTMKHKRIRHLPVVDDTDELVGMISIGDINAFEIGYLHTYLDYHGSMEESMWSRMSKYG
jgi:CBS domain-containing protein